MKVVALVSGGKDSCFNILHCLARGHEVVALANLRPADTSVQELDSFMFQTVGHDVLDYYSECIDLPMYRGDIRGSSKNQELDYKPTEDDEIEDLFLLIRRVMQSQPEVEAISVGAILSSYQRTRVENVCQRLGLTSLAFLWQRNQLELMTEMVGSTMDARLIKVAAIGLNETHLGKSLKEMFPILLKLNQKFDVHICGEGGEFETLVLDAPFFIKKLEIVNSEKVVSNDQVAYLKPTVAVKEKSVLDAEYHNIHDMSVKWSIFLPESRGLLHDPFDHVYKILDHETGEQARIEKMLDYAQRTKPSSTKIDNKLFISNIYSIADTIEGQVHGVFQFLETVLKIYKIDPSHIQQATLLVSSMSNFGLINSIYSKHFKSPLPPSRVCVQTKLPQGAYLQLSLVISIDKSKRSGLHVQGRSYWAPANIGPYSQTILDEDLTATLSGQIPLIPSSMELSQENDAFNTVLSLQHLTNVKVAVGCTNQLSIVAFVKSPTLVRTVVQTWKLYGEEGTGENPENVLLIAQVEDLPKGANVEWSGLSYKKVSDLYQDDEDEDETVDEEINETSEKFIGLSLQETSHHGNSSTFVSTITLSHEEFREFNFSEKLHYTIYTKPENITNLCLEKISIEHIPVAKLWNYQGELKDYGLVIRH